MSNYLDYNEIQNSFFLERVLINFGSMLKQTAQTDVQIHNKQKSEL